MKVINMGMCIQQKVKFVLSKYSLLPLNEMSDELLMNQLNFNSFDKLELIYDLEDAFEIEFPTPIWEVHFEEQFKTIGALISIVEELSQGR